MSAGTLPLSPHAICLLGCVMAALPMATSYADPDPRPIRQGSVFMSWEPLSAEALDRLRGGFVDLSGIKISFGLERMVWLNGELVQSLALNVPDLASLRKGSIGAVSVQGPASAVSVPVVTAEQPGSLSQPQQAAVQAETLAAQSRPLPASTAIATGGTTSAAVPTSAASVVQNGPGNVVMPEVLRNLGPGVFTVVQNSLNGQTIQGLTIINAQVSGLGSILRNNTFLDLHLTLRGAGR